MITQKPPSLGAHKNAIVSGLAWGQELKRRSALVWCTRGAGVEGITQEIVNNARTVLHCPRLNTTIDLNNAVILTN